MCLSNFQIVTYFPLLSCFEIQLFDALQDPRHLCDAPHSPGIWTHYRAAQLTVKDKNWSIKDILFCVRYLCFTENRSSKPRSDAYCLFRLTLNSVVDLWLCCTLDERSASNVWGFAFCVWFVGLEFPYECFRSFGFGGRFAAIVGCALLIRPTWVLWLVFGSCVGWISEAHSTFWCLVWASVLVVRFALGFVGCSDVKKPPVRGLSGGLVWACFAFAACLAYLKL